jgi:hypothetical protein
MDDQEKLDEIKRIFDTAKPFGYEDLEVILPIMKSLEDIRDRDSYICVCAEWLANHGQLQDLDRALNLARSVKFLAPKYAALNVVASRFFREGYREDALSILSESTNIVIELERNEDYSALEKAIAWDQIADIYYEFNEASVSKDSWIKAKNFAQIGLYDPRKQEVHDNNYFLYALAKKLAERGYMNEAIETAQVIIMESWKQSALSEIQKEKRKVTTQ